MQGFDLIFDAPPEGAEKGAAAKPEPAKAATSPTPDVNATAALTSAFLAQSPCDRSVSEASDESGDRLLEKLNPPQREAVLHDEGPLLILAGAGSGKTRVITRRIAYLTAVRGISPFAILAITFTNKAAAEMKQRVKELVGEIADRMWIGTFHSMFARILRRHAERLGYSANFTIADTADSQQMIRQLVRENDLDEKRFDARLVLSQISSAKNSLRSPEAYGASVGENPLFKTIAKLYQQYQARMLQSDCMDFDDILVNTVRLFKEHSDLLEQYQERFRYVLVDEYQDTNGAQYQIVKLLAARHKNLCVVGDDDQSIYAFRGADIRNILDFEKDYKNCKTIKLEQNYRSSETILAAANALIANNKGRKKKKLWTGAQQGERVSFVRAHNHFDEARYIAQEIVRRRKADRELRFADFAILYRANALSRNLETALREAGIPYRIYGGLRFYDRKEIKDVLAYLRLVASDRDELAFLRAVNNPRRGIGDATIEALQMESARSGEPMLKLCAMAGRYPALARAANKLQAFAALIFKLRETLLENGLSFQQYVEFVQEESGLLDAILEDRAQGKELAAERIENLKELLSDALEFSQQIAADEALFFPPQPSDAGPLAEAAASASDATEAVTVPQNEETNAGGGAGEATLTEALQAFLSRAALYSEQDLDSSSEDFVRLMTIHAAKGLEFLHVFLVCAENGVFPSARSLQEADGLEEERRLAYVAITRAMRKLYITTARSRTLYGQTQMYPVSVFVREIPLALMDELGGSSRGDEAAYASGGSSRWSGAAPARGAGNSLGGSASGSGAGIFGQDSTARSGANAGSGSSQTRAGFTRGLDPTGLSFLKSLNRSAASSPGAAGSASAQPYLKAKQVRAGQKVRSERYGSGVILRAEPLADDAIIEVQFGSARPKRLLLNQAKLRAEEE